MKLNKDDRKLQAENKENMADVLPTWKYESEIPVEIISSDVNIMVSKLGECEEVPDNLPSCDHGDIFDKLRRSICLGFKDLNILS